MGQNAPVRAQPSVKAKVPRWGRRGNEQLLSLYAPPHAHFCPPTPPPTKTNQLAAPAHLNAAFAVAWEQKVLAQGRPQLRLGRRGVLKPYGPAEEFM